MPTAEILTVVMGASSFLGIAGLIAYLYFTIQVRRVEFSVRSSLEGESLFNAEQVLKVLSQFQDDKSRFDALRELTTYDSAKIKALLLKVESNIDIDRIHQRSSKLYRQLALISGVFFLAVAGVAMVYSWLSSPTKPVERIQPAISPQPDAAGPKPSKADGLYLTALASRTKGDVTDAWAKCQEAAKLEEKYRTDSNCLAIEHQYANSAQANSLYLAAFDLWNNKGDVANAWTKCQAAAQLEKRYSTDPLCKKIGDAERTLNQK